MTTTPAKTTLHAPVTLSVKRTWPFARYVPLDDVSKAICTIAKREILKESELTKLQSVGFLIKVTEQRLLAGDFWNAKTF